MQIERMKTIATAIVALLGLFVSAVFATRKATPAAEPMTEPTAVTSPATSNKGDREATPLDRTGFDRAVLFLGETQSKAKISTPTGPVASLGPLSLVAIVNGEDGHKKAALFGAASNELVLLGKEEKHGAVHVLEIDERGVDLEQEGNRVRLSLVDGPRDAKKDGK